MSSQQYQTHTCTHCLICICAGYLTSFIDIISNSSLTDARMVQWTSRTIPHRPSSRNPLWCQAWGWKPSRHTTRRIGWAGGVQHPVVPVLVSQDCTSLAERTSVWIPGIQQAGSDAGPNVSSGDTRATEGAPIRSCYKKGKAECGSSGGWFLLLLSFLHTEAFAVPA